jgi:FixJ family two-component response regulator
MEAADRLSDNTRITVAVLDVRLGNGTVHAVASKLSRRGVPIIFHTGHGAVEMVSAQWPGSRILAKPARSDELLAAILAAFKAPAL